MTLAARVRRRLTRARGLPSDGPLIVALSGGLDSQVLLHLLRFGNVWRGELFAAHYDHRMRTRSAADAAWVAGLCQAWEVPLITAVTRTPLHSETVARTARYEFLAAAAAVVPDALVATAHHADDQVETILFRLLRGTGLRGLRGIPVRRGRFVRPLLSCSRAELEAYAGDHDIRPRFDYTNYELTRPRTRIRRLVLPALERARPGARAAVLQLGRHAREGERVLDTLADELEATGVERPAAREFLLASRVWQAYDPRVQAQLLRRMLRRLGSVPGRAGTRAAIQFISAGRSGTRSELPAGVRLERSFDHVVLRRAVDPEIDEPAVIAGPAAGTAAARIGGRRLVVHWRINGGEESGPGVRLDPAAVRFPLRLRGWQPGDRIRLRYGSKKLKKLFGELRLSREARSRTPVLAEGRGRILWVVGHACAAEDAVAPAGAALHITVHDV